MNGQLKQFVALVTINNNIHNINEDLKGDYIKLSKNQDNGSKVEIDGNIMYITNEGQIIK